MASPEVTISLAPLPHEFRELRKGNRNPVLIFGAGLSVGRVPTPLKLLSEVQTQAEEDLACGHVAELPETNDALYLWAEEVLERIAGTVGPPLKLRLARAMGLVIDRRWAVDVDLNGALPRHRVIARLAREELWASIWSLNWDCMLESALEDVGLNRGQALRDQPWLTRYAAIVTDEDHRLIGQQDLLCLIKPHGCAHALSVADEAFRNGNIPRADELSSRFLITKTELQSARSSKLDHKFFFQMVAELQSKPLIVAGWSISEPYLVGVIEEPLASLLSDPKEEDLSIIDISFNSQGHEKIAECYKVKESDVFFQVTRLGEGFDIDDLFLWLQAKYCLDQLVIASPSAASELESINSSQTPSAHDPLLINWVDKFLPAWTRLCWRSNLVDCAGYQIHKLDLDRRNEHVPWRIPKNLPRPDLVAAAKLLPHLMRNKGAWDCDKFPGGLWDYGKSRLVIPVPAWGWPNELAGIRPLVAEWSSAWPYVEVVEILPLHHAEGTSSLAGSVVSRLTDTVASFMTVSRFADPRNIVVANDIGT